MAQEPIDVESLVKRLPQHYVVLWQRLRESDPQKAQEFWDKWAYVPAMPKTKLNEQRERIIKRLEGNRLVRRV